MADLHATGIGELDGITEMDLSGIDFANITDLSPLAIHYVACFELFSWSCFVGQGCSASLCQIKVMDEVTIITAMSRSPHATKQGCLEGQLKRLVQRHSSISEGHVSDETPEAGFAPTTVCDHVEPPLIVSR